MFWSIVEFLVTLPAAVLFLLVIGWMGAGVAEVTRSILEPLSIWVLKALVGVGAGVVVMMALVEVAAGAGLLSNPHALTHIAVWLGIWQWAAMLGFKAQSTLFAATQGDTTPPQAHKP